MRISDRLVFQDVDGGGEYVLVDDRDGTEIVLTAAEVARLHVGIGMAFVGRDPYITAALTEARQDASRRNAP